MTRKGKVRHSAFFSALATVGGVVSAVVTDPTILAHAAGKLGVGVAVLGAIAQAVTKPITRADSER